LAKEVFQIHGVDVHDEADDDVWVMLRFCPINQLLTWQA
jgi:hypothetical protein